jgi:hypothetical protein
MTTKLLESPTGAYELWPDTGRFELQAANENFAPTVQTSLEAFKEKLLATTAFTPIQSQLWTYKKRALDILELWQLSEEEQTTLKLAQFFGTFEKAAAVILADRKPEAIRYMPANDNYGPRALAA